jgi:hypothetical protein
MVPPQSGQVARIRLAVSSSGSVRRPPWPAEPTLPFGVVMAEP